MAPALGMVEWWGPGVEFLRARPFRQAEASPQPVENSPEQATVEPVDQRFRLVSRMSLALESPQPPGSSSGRGCTGASSNFNKTPIAAALRRAGRPLKILLFFTRARVSARKSSSNPSDLVLA